ncbi:MAG: ABC transporter ATP-binding protein/permease [Oscillospiraceae bacterium]|jgi:ATP-binding cassette subfamily B protein|nr:ABC transporter ATP-binding protein/permease [Oscillospiraceae bacterium]
MKKLLRNLGNMIYLLRPYWRHRKLYCAVNLLNAVVIEPLPPLCNIALAKGVVDALIQGKPYADILRIAGFYVAVMLAVSMINWVIARAYQDPKGGEIEMKINGSIYAQTLRTDYKYFDDPEFYNNFTWAASEYAAKSKDAFACMLNTVNCFMRVASIAALSAVLGPWVVIISAVCIFVSFAMSLRLTKINMRLKTEIVPRDRRMAYIHRVFYTNTNAANLKSTDAKRFLLDSYERAGRQRVGLFRKYAFVRVKWLWLRNVVGYANRFFSVAYAAFGVVRGNIADIGTYAALVEASNEFIRALLALLDNVTQMNELSLYAEKIRAFFELKSEIEVPRDTPAAPVASGAFAVEIRDAGFGYANSNFKLDGLNISIKAGDKIGIVGENGAGKSTLAKLLLRLYDLQSGDILFNGTPIRDFDVRELRRRIGIAFQSPNVYALPLSDNLRVYGAADSAKLTEILARVGLGKLLEKSGAMLDSEVTKEFDPNGIVLSGGEAQKLGLARLLTADFGLILLDEPSSALDPIAEHEMTRLLFNRANTATTIMIAHRLSSVRDADRIFLIDGGKVRECGTHDELVAANGRYAEMFAKQAAGYGR